MKAPTTIRSGFMKSSTALPSRRNSGWEAMAAPLPSSVSRLAKRATEPGGTVDFTTKMALSSTTGASSSMTPST